MRPLRRPARELRRAIDEMPLDTRQAMLDAIGRQPKRPALPGAPGGRPLIIVGAYSSPDGGICPMLAAHRNGGRTDYAEFARAWDRYARAGRRPRPATDGELTALRTMLAASIAEDDVSSAGALARAIDDHRRALRSRLRREEHEVEPYQPADPRELDYSASPGRTNCSSGTMQAGEVLSR
ncbi:MAG TPA: hypothetical protein VHF90_06220 [Thermoleophilaceae bacterium]|nr:hypothetical protein [Thermoleophilaceae bacterium]